jgi:hypothetical protein
VNEGGDKTAESYFARDINYTIITLTKKNYDPNSVAKPSSRIDSPSKTKNFIRSFFSDKKKGDHISNIRSSLPNNNNNNNNNNNSNNNTNSGTPMTSGNNQSVSFSASVNAGRSISSDAEKRSKISNNDGTNLPRKRPPSITSSSSFTTFEQIDDISVVRAEETKTEDETQNSFLVMKHRRAKSLVHGSDCTIGQVKKPNISHG